MGLAKYTVLRLCICIIFLLLCTLIISSQEDSKHKVSMTVFPYIYLNGEKAGGFSNAVFGMIPSIEYQFTTPKFNLALKRMAFMWFPLSVEEKLNMPVLYRRGIRYWNVSIQKSFRLNKFIRVDAGTGPAYMDAGDRFVTRQVHAARYEGFYYKKIGFEFTLKSTIKVLPTFYISPSYTYGYFGTPQYDMQYGALFLGFTF
jgi:hypothetical protein